MPSLRLLIAALLVSHVALAQVPPPMEEGETEVDVAREEQIADQIERLRTDPRWVAFAAAWRRREESVLPPRPLEPLLPLAQRAAEAFNTLTAGIDAIRLENIEMPPGLMFIADGEEGLTGKVVFNWYGFSEFAQSYGLPEDAQFFTLMAEDVAEATDGCPSLTQELWHYSAWRAFSNDYPHAFVRVAGHRLLESMNRLSVLSRSTDDAESATTALQQFLDEQPNDQLAPLLRSRLRAIESGLFATQVECVGPEEEEAIETTTSAAALREIKPLAPPRR